MRVSTSILSQSMNRILGASRPTSTQRKSKQRSAKRRLVMESLERRELYSTDLISAFAIGNDVGKSRAMNVAADTAGNSYMTGSFSGRVDFDPSATHAGDTDILTARGAQDAYVAKYAPDNSLIWARRMGGDSATASVALGQLDTGANIQVDGSGNVYVVGNFAGSSDFGSKTLTTAGDQDGFVVKLDSNGAVQWANRWGLAGDNNGTGIGVDGMGNVYTRGTRLGDSTNIGGMDIQKFSPTGSAVWSKFIATRMNSSGRIAVDSVGNIFAAGTFNTQNGLVDFDPSSRTYYASAGANSLATGGFVLKLNSQGNFGWVDAFQGQAAGGYSFASSVALDSSSNIIVGGYYRGAVDFNFGNGTAILANNGGFIAKLTQTGGFVWARALDTDAESQAGVSGLAVDPLGGIYVTGGFNGTIDLDPGIATVSRTTVGKNDAFVLNLTSAGNFGWVETFGGPEDDVATGIAVDQTGMIYLAGYFTGTVDFDPSAGTYNLSTPGTYSSGFLLRLRRRA